jgi:mannose/fructose/N-acetylgalactosamine-specific phosphotransferase system component IID
LRVHCQCPAAVEDLQELGATSVCPALKRLHECETVDRYRALQREPSSPQARSTSATLVAAVADGVGERATQSSQMAARHQGLLKHELADQRSATL